MLGAHGAFFVGPVFCNLKYIDQLATPTTTLLSTMHPLAKQIDLQPYLNAKLQ